MGNQNNNNNNNSNNNNNNDNSKNDQIKEKMKNYWENFEKKNDNKIEFIEEEKNVNNEKINKENENNLNNEKKENNLIEVKNQKLEIEENINNINNQEENKNTENKTLNDINYIFQNINNNEENYISLNKNNNKNKEEFKKENENNYQINLNQNNNEIKENNNEKKETKNENISDQKNNKKIDFENVAIEKIFQITLNEENKKYYFLEIYYAQLLSLDSELKFKLSNLDLIIESIINYSDYNRNLLDYFFKCFHRGYEMIEIRFKKELGEKFYIILNIISSNIIELITNPKEYFNKNNLNSVFNPLQLKKIIIDYLSETNFEEILFFIKNLYKIENIEKINEYFNNIFISFHFKNIIEKNNFFNSKQIQNNINLIIKILDNFEEASFVLTNKNEFFLPKNINNGKEFHNTFLGRFISLVPLDCHPDILNKNISNNFFNFNDINNYQIKLNSIINNLTNIFSICMKKNKEKIFDYFYSIIEMNFEFNKINSNYNLTSSVGFIFNCFLIGLNLFYEECKIILNDDNKNSLKEINNIIKIIKKIDFNFVLSDEKIKFSKFNIIQSEISKFLREKYKNKEFNNITKLFFINHILLGYSINKIKEFYYNLYEKIVPFLSQGIHNLNNPMTNKFIVILKTLDIYVKNKEIIYNILKFHQITFFYLLSFNNSLFQKEETNYENFIKIFYNFMDYKSNEILSSFPEYLITNIINSIDLFRTFSIENFFNNGHNFDMISNLVYFAIIYSSRMELLHNPHLRSQCFDILLKVFILGKFEERNKIISLNINKMLKDEWIRNNLIASLMRVYVDSERLGTSHQFEDRHNVRNKIYILVHNIFKNNSEDFKERIINYSEQNKFEATKMILLLMENVTYFLDEVIMKLIDIKNYQDLKENEEKWNELNEEKKNLENNKFINNDYLLKIDSKFLNNSLEYLVIICSCLQKFFESLNLCQRLAELLNYCLDEFTSKSKHLKVKNKNDYEFQPSFILTSLIKIYVYFKHEEKFLEFVVSDERSYKYDNFLKAIEIKNHFEKVKIDYEIFEDFKDLVYNILKKYEDKNNKNKINLDDVPEEFLDPLMNTIMEDPVILPHSKINIDRNTIITYLLTNPTDPFNRTPLKVEDLIPNNELKEKIMNYLKSKNSK